MRTEDEIRADAVDERPFSNGTEYDMFAGRFCYRCVNDDGMADPPLHCPIITVALSAGSGGRTAWPKEWTRERRTFTTLEGKPSFYEYVDACTEFEERRDPGPGDPEPEPPPAPDVDGQIDLIEYAVERFIDELEQPQPVPIGGVK